jgi:predicted AlkP superfamily phosphohydrolase/phosphomutase
MDYEGFVLIGVDGGSYNQINRLVNDGYLENFAELIGSGAFLEMEPCIPVDTPTNWATIATGSCSIDHGVVSFTTHVPGEDPTAGLYADRTQLSSFCLSEFLWESMNRQGMRTAVLNYPVSWPVRDADTILIGSIVPGGKPWRISDGIVYSTRDEVDLVNEIKETKPHVKKIKLIRDRAELEHPALGTVTATVENSTARLNIQGSTVVSQEGEWSGPVRVNVQGRDAFLRLKVIRAEDDELTIYFSQIFAGDGWSNPPSLAGELAAAGMPYIEGETPYLSDGDKSPFGPIDLNPRLALEYAELQSEWFAKAASFIRSRIPYKGLVLHNHLIDTLNHTMLSTLEPTNPFYDEVKAEMAQDIYRRAYVIIDKMIGKLRAIFRNWLIVVTSDHSALPTWTYVSLEHALIREGLVKYEDMGNGKLVFDDKRSSAFVYHDSKQIWVNLKGREPHGIVEEGEYEDVLRRIEDALYSLRDPRDNSRIVRLVARRSLWGIGRGSDRFGDLTYFLRPGYSDWDGTNSSVRFDVISEARAHEAIAPLRYVSGHHTVYLPNEKYGDFTNAAFTIFGGRNMGSFRGRARLVDIAPTISYLMGRSPPRNSTGRLLYEAVSPG